nr:trypsin-like peptidase domain-containing protein [Actinomycetota bacterium]
VALHLPGETELRQGAQRSSVLRRLNELVPPTRLIRAIERVDPLPAIAGPIAPVAPPDPALTGVAAVGRAAPSVVRVVGVACGLGVSGSGWVGARELVVTAAHVVAGQEETWVEQDGSGERFEATAVAFDVRNDVAVLRVEGLDAPPLRSVAASPGRAVAILGYPGDGGLVATAGRVGPTTVVLTEDAYGQGPVARKLTSVRGRIRHGNSGGPAINARGEVETTVFAARVGSQGGFGVPSDLVVRALAGARGPVSTGDCTGG